MIKNAKSEKIFFTAQGYTKLENDLAATRAKREPALVRLQSAREQGDLSENGAYKAARFELSDIDRTIRRLTYLLKQAEVREPRRDGTIGFGNTVTLDKAGKEITYLLVSKYESDPLKGKLSIESPLGRSLIGKKVGDTVSIDAPVGNVRYTLKHIS